MKRKNSVIPTKKERGISMKMTKEVLKELLGGKRNVEVSPGINTYNGKILPHLVIVGYKGKKFDSRKLMKISNLMNDRDDKGELILYGPAKSRFLQCLWGMTMIDVRHEYFKELLEKSITVVIMPNVRNGSLSGITEDDLKWIAERTKNHGKIVPLYPKLAHGGVQGSGIGHGGRVFISKENLVDKWFNELGTDTSKMTPAKKVDRTNRLLGERGHILEHLKLGFSDKELYGIIPADRIWLIARGLCNGDKISGYKVKGSILAVKDLFVKKGIYMELPADTVKLNGPVTEEDIRVIDSRRAKANSSWNVGRDPHISFEMLCVLYHQGKVKVDYGRLVWLAKMVEGKGEPTDYIKTVGWPKPESGVSKGYESKLVPGVMLDMRVGKLMESFIIEGKSMEWMMKESMWIHDKIMKSLSSVMREIINPRVPGFYGVIMPWDRDEVGIPLKAIHRSHAYMVIPPVNYPVRFKIVPTRDDCIWIPKKFILAIGKDFDGDLGMGYFIPRVHGLPDWKENKREILDLMERVTPEKIDDLNDPRSSLNVMSNGITHYLDIGTMTNRVNIVEDMARKSGMELKEILDLRMTMFFDSVQPHIDALKYTGKGDLPDTIDIALKHGIDTDADVLESISSWYRIRKPNIEDICLKANTDTLDSNSKSFYERLLLNFKGIHPVENQFKKRVAEKKKKKF